MTDLNTRIALNALGKRLIFSVTEESAVSGRAVSGARDISAATTLKAEVRAPDGTITELDGSFLTDGTDGKLLAIANPTTATVFDALGEWSARCHFAGSGFEDWTPWRSLEVY